MPAEEQVRLSQQREAKKREGRRGEKKKSTKEIKKSETAAAILSNLSEPFNVPSIAVSGSMPGLIQLQSSASFLLSPANLFRDQQKSAGAEPCPFPDSLAQGSSTQSYEAQHPGQKTLGLQGCWVDWLI